MLLTYVIVVGVVVDEVVLVTDDLGLLEDERSLEKDLCEMWTPQSREWKGRIYKSVAGVHLQKISTVVATIRFEIVFMFYYDNLLTSHIAFRN